MSCDQNKQYFACECKCKLQIVMSEVAMFFSLAFQLDSSYAMPLSMQFFMSYKIHECSIQVILYNLFCCPFHALLQSETYPKF